MPIPPIIPIRNLPPQRDFSAKGGEDYSIAKQNHLSSRQVQSLAVGTAEQLAGLTPQIFTDANGFQWIGLLATAGTSPSRLQWQVELNADNKPTIGPGSVLFDDPLALTPATVTGYSAVTGWTAASAPSDGEFVCWKITLDSSADITSIELAVRDVSGSGWYDLSGAWIQYMHVPIAKISVDTGVYSVAYQYVTGIPHLERVLIDAANGYWVR